KTSALSMGHREGGAQRLADVVVADQPHDVARVRPVAGLRLRQHLLRARLAEQRQLPHAPVGTRRARRLGVLDRRAPAVRQDVFDLLAHLWRSHRRQVGEGSELHALTVSSLSTVSNSNLISLQVSIAALSSGLALAA